MDPESSDPLKCGAVIPASMQPQVIIFSNRFLVGLSKYNLVIMITDFSEIEDSTLKLDKLNKRLADKLLQNTCEKINPET